MLCRFKRSRTDAAVKLASNLYPARKIHWHFVSIDGAMVQAFSATSFSAALACLASSPITSLTKMLVSSAAINLPI